MLLKTFLHNGVRIGVFAEHGLVLYPVHIPGIKMY